MNFDPTQPYEILDATTPAFDPNQPHEVLDESGGGFDPSQPFEVLDAEHSDPLGLDSFSAKGNLYNGPDATSPSGRPDAADEHAPGFFQDFANRVEHSAATGLDRTGENIARSISSFINPSNVDQLRDANLPLSLKSAVLGTAKIGADALASKLQSRRDYLDKAYSGQTADAPQLINPANDRNASAKVAEAGGEFAAQLPSLTAGLPVMVGSMAMAAHGGAYDAAYTGAKKKGMSDQEAQDLAMHAGNMAAVKTAPELAAYLVAGKLGASFAAKLLKPETNALVKAAVGTGTALAANMAASSGIRAVNGQDARPDAGNVTTDALFALMHGKGVLNAEKASKPTLNLGGLEESMRKRQGEALADPVQPSALKTGELDTISEAKVPDSVNSDSVPVEISPTNAALTPEAGDLLAKLEKSGAAPLFISRKLERIAAENGVEITDTTKPNEVISALMAKRETKPTEDSQSDPQPTETQEPEMADVPFARKPEDLSNIDPVPDESDLARDRSKIVQDTDNPHEEKALQDFLGKAQEFVADSLSDTRRVGNPAGQSDTRYTQATDARAAEAVSRYFRKKIIWIEGKNLFFDGAIDPAQPGHIFLDVNAKKPFQTVVGHELLHHLQNEHPDVYQTLAENIQGITKDLGVFRKEKLAVGYSDNQAKLQAEFLGDVFGDHLGDSRLWSKLAEREPTTFGRIAQTIHAWLTKLKTYLSANNFQSNRFITDIDAARNHVSDALVKWKLRQSKLAGIANALGDPDYARKTSPVAKESWKETAKEFWKGGDIKEFSPFHEALNRMTGRVQKGSLEATRIAAEIKKSVPNKLKREGITNWIQADGDAKVLQQRATDSTDAKLKAGYEAALNLTPGEIDTANRIRKWYDGILKVAQGDGLVETGLKNYVNQIWHTPPSTLAGGGSGRLNTNFRFGKERTFENFFEGEQAGFKPKTKDIAELVPVYGAEMNRATASRRFVRDLTKLKASDGRPLAVPMGSEKVSKGEEGNGPSFIEPRSKGADYADYKPTNHSAMKGWKWIGNDTNGEAHLLHGQLQVHPEIGAHVEAAIMPSTIDRPDLAATAGEALAKHAFKGLLSAQSFIKQNMLSIPIFHYTQEGTHALGHLVNPFFGLKAVDSRNSAHVDAMNHSLMLGPDMVGEHQWIDGVGGNRVLMHRIPVLGKLLKSASEFLFHDYIPMLKVATYEKALRRNMRRFEGQLDAKKVTEDDVKYLTARQVNSAYGHLNYADMGWSQNTLKLQRAFLLAPDFLFARGKFAASAIRGTLGGGPAHAEQRLAFWVLATTFYSAARILNSLFNDNDPKWGIEDAFTVHAGGRKYTMRSVPEDLLKLLTSPRQFTTGRVSPLVRIGMEWASGLNWKGQKVGARQQVIDAASQALPLGMKDLIADELGWKSLSESDVTLFETFLNSSGIHVNRDSEMNSAFKIFQEWKKKQGIETNGATFPTSPYLGLQHALEDNSEAKAQKEFQFLVESKGLEKVVEGFVKRMHHPMTDSADMDKKMMSDLDAKEKTVVEKAKAEKIELLKRFEAMVLQQTANPKVRTELQKGRMLLEKNGEPVPKPPASRFHRPRRPRPFKPHLSYQRRLTPTYSFAAQNDDDE